MHMYMIEFQAVIFDWFLCSFGPLSRALVAYHLERGGIPLNNEFGANCERGTATDIKAQVPSIWLCGKCWKIINKITMYNSHNNKKYKWLG